MTETEKRIFIEKLRRLPFEAQMKFYYMVLGAAYAAKANKEEK